MVFIFFKRQVLSKCWHSTPKAQMRLHPLGMPCVQSQGMRQLLPLGIYLLTCNLYRGRSLSLKNARVWMES